MYLRPLWRPAVHIRVPIVLRGNLDSKFDLSDFGNSCHAPTHCLTSYSAKSSLTTPFSAPVEVVPLGTYHEKPLTDEDMPDTFSLAESQSELSHPLENGMLDFDGEFLDVAEEEMLPEEVVGYPTTIESHEDDDRGVSSVFPTFVGNKDTTLLIDTLSSSSVDILQPFDDSSRKSNSKCVDNTTNYTLLSPSTPYRENYPAEFSFEISSSCGIHNIQKLSLNDRCVTFSESSSPCDSLVPGFFFPRSFPRTKVKKWWMDNDSSPYLEHITGFITLLSLRALLLDLTREQCLMGSQIDALSKASSEKPTDRRYFSNMLRLQSTALILKETINIVKKTLRNYKPAYSQSIAPIIDSLEFLNEL